MRRWGLHKAQGGKNAKKRAVVAVARKLAVLMHRLWLTGEVYDPLHREGVAPAPPTAGSSGSSRSLPEGGMEVMSESGESVGKVDKVTIDEDGTVASYHSTTGFFGSKHDIEPSEVVSASKDKLIISDNAREGAVKTVTG